jgi:hypothetical protein
MKVYRTKQERRKHKFPLLSSPKREEAKEKRRKK